MTHARTAFLLEGKRFCVDYLGSVPSVTFASWCRKMSFSAFFFHKYMCFAALMPEINRKASVGIEYSVAVVLLKCLHGGRFFTMDLGSPLNGQFFICHIGKFSLSVFNEFFFSLP